jgi:hypothetical protein
LAGAFQVVVVFRVANALSFLVVVVVVVVVIGSGGCSFSSFLCFVRRVYNMTIHKEKNKKLTCSSAS